MSAMHPEWYDQLRRLCDLNRELASVVDRAVAARNAGSSPPATSPPANGTAQDLADAVRAQQAVFASLLCCLDALGAGPGAET